MVLVAFGVKPETDLGSEAGLKVGPKGVFLTNRRTESNVPDIFVTGDRRETWHRLLNRYFYLRLGTTAHKQAASRARIY